MCPLRHTACPLASRLVAARRVQDQAGQRGDRLGLCRIVWWQFRLLLYGVQCVQVARDGGALHFNGWQDAISCRLSCLVACMTQRM